MKVIAINGSPRQKGNTYHSLNKVMEALESEGIATELAQMGGGHYHGCIACYKCVDKKDRQCHGPKDDMRELIAKITEADGVLIGSPVYFGSVTAEVKALIDRAGLVAKANDHLYSRKVGAAVVSVRRQGALTTFNQINQFFLINMMIVPGSCYWNLAVGRDPGEVLNDEEGMRTMVTLGANMAWLLKKLNV
jgi:multimeric flavodoxin WrbA